MCCVDGEIKTWRRFGAAGITEPITSTDTVMTAQTQPMSPRGWQPLLWVQLSDIHRILPAGGSEARVARIRVSDSVWRAGNTKFARIKRRGKRPAHRDDGRMLHAD